MKKTQISIWLLCIAMLLVSCFSSKESSSETSNTDSRAPAASPEKQSPAPTADYITLTYSEYATTDENGAIKTQILSYDTDTKKIKTVFQFDYTAQYPLGFYDKPNQLVYYTQRVGTDKDHGDQIFVKDLLSEKNTQLTDNLFAVNYIIPSGDQLFFVANVKGEQAIRLGAVDLNSMEMTLWGDDDILVEAITLDQNNKKIYASAYSLKERQYNLAHQDGPVGQNNFKMPTYTIYETDYNLKEKTKLFSNNYWIRMLMNKEGHVIAFGDKKYNQGQVPSMVVDYDTGNKTISLSKWGTTRLQRGEANYSYDGSKIYAIAVVKNERGLFEYDVKSNQFTALFTPTAGFINNIQVVRGF
ncbi:hypothetical protein [Paenibacillus algicola]|uniref:hypothetical protein n=1 Tax=Paenibacillus algicola TaxID=2565926 RepID=UPI001E42F5A2|nr:hypothetical protein [Paenibacillus algicola]